MNLKHPRGLLEICRLASPEYAQLYGLYIAGEPRDMAIVKESEAWPAETNAERLVACWNACEGMREPAMEIADLRTRSANIPAMCAEVEALRSRCADLINALKSCEGFLSAWSRASTRRGQAESLAFQAVRDNAVAMFAQQADTARAAIAKAKGQL